MESLILDEQQLITIRPAAVFAFMHLLTFILASLGFLLLAWRCWPELVWISLSSAVYGLYRFCFLRSVCYTVSPETICIRRGVFFKRTDQVALYRMKDYVLTQPFLLQLFYLMNVKLKSTDPENPIIWLRGIPASDLLDTLRGYVQQARLNNKVYDVDKPLQLFLSK
ncbi:PH domain-containing protein [Mucilaginibacter endophyticus]|uniref:PH domain-containing protein n=1 Tax=Mucilaginibacter endophyticus TaxID=2675003 RepID=UPI000E0D7CC4|nr:PH domain-containing protein [Mucilaginibacter endophyticus]